MKKVQQNANVEAPASFVPGPDFLGFLESVGVREPDAQALAIGRVGIHIASAERLAANQRRIEYAMGARARKACESTRAARSQLT